MIYAKSLSLILFNLFLVYTFNSEKKEEPPVTYSKNIRPIISQYCLNCHAGKRPKSKLDLSTYENLKKAIENKNLLLRINNKKRPMPKGGLMPLEKRKLIEKWVNQEFKK